MTGSASDGPARACTYLDPRFGLLPNIPPVTRWHFQDTVQHVAEPDDQTLGRRDHSYGRTECWAETSDGAAS